MADELAPSGRIRGDIVRHAEPRPVWVCRGEQRYRGIETATAEAGRARLCNWAESSALGHYAWVWAEYVEDRHADTEHP